MALITRDTSSKDIVVICSTKNYRLGPTRWPRRTRTSKSHAAFTSRPFSMHSSWCCCCVSPLMKPLNHSPRDCLLVAATLNANQINRPRASCCCLRHLTASHSQCFPNEPCIWTHLKPAHHRPQRRRFITFGINYLINYKRHKRNRC